MGSIETQLSSLIQGGNYPAAFQLASQTGNLGLLTNPVSLAKIAGPNGIPESKYSAFINAFAPYESSLTGTADTTAHGDFGIGTPVWSKNDDLGQRTQNAITETNNMDAAIQQVGLSQWAAGDLSPTQQALLGDTGGFGNSGITGDAVAGYHKMPYGGAYGVSGLAKNVPDLSSIFAEVQGNSTWANAAPAVEALAAVVAPAAISYFGPAAGASTGAADASAGVAPITSESLSYSTDALTASNVAAGGITDTGALASDSTLADVTVTAPAAGGSAGSLAGEAVPATIASTAPVTVGTQTPTLSTTPNPSVTSGPTGLSQYTPKNLISSGLQNAGLGQTPSDVIGGAVQGAGTSSLRGGSPVTGAVTGGVGAGVGDVTSSGTAGSVASSLTGAAMAPTQPSPQIYAPPATLAANPLVPQNPTSGINLTTPITAPTLDTSAAPAAVGAQPTSGSGFDLSSLMSTLFPNGASGLGAPLTEGALALYEANQAKNQNDAFANTLLSAGQPLVNAGQNELTNAQTGKLNPQAAGLQTSQTTQGNTLVGQAGPLLNIGNTAFQNFVAGSLPPWQQTELDQQKAAALAQAKQSMGSQVDSSTMGQIQAQIDSQYDIAKGNLMQQNLGIGEQAFAQGQQVQQLGFSDIQAGWQTGMNAIQQSFNNAVSLMSAGFGPIEDAIQLKIQGDTQITDSLMQMMGLIGLGYAQSQAGNKPGTTGGGTKLPSIPGSSPSTGGGTSGGTSATPGTTPSTTDPTSPDYTNTGTNPWTGQTYTDPGSTDLPSWYDTPSYI